MILVTGAAGKTGRAAIRALAAKGAAVRALVHRPEQVPDVDDAGASETTIGDLRDCDAVARAAHGVRAVYHIAPNVSPYEVEIGQVVIAACQASGVLRLVYHSVLHPQTEEMPHHWQKLRVEERLLRSGLAFTILQPAPYMQNLLAYWARIVGDGVLAVPYAVDTRLGLVDLEDVAQAAARVLTEPGHAGASYELGGPEVLSQAEIATVLAEELHRPVRVEVISRAEWRAGARASGLGAYQVGALVRMFEYYERYGFWGNPGVLEWLLEGQPATLGEFVTRTVGTTTN